MRTSATRIYNSRDAPAGFTIIELMVVLTLLAVAMFIAVPTFQSLLQGSVAKEINRLSGVIRLVRSEAILTRKPFRLMINLKEGQYSVEQRTEFGEFIPRDEPKALRPHKLPGSFKLKDIVIFGNRFERSRENTVPIVVSPSGFIDPFSLHFEEDGKAWTLKVSGFSPRIKLEEGNVEFRQEDL